MATIPKIIADFEAQLATAISIGSTTFSLSTATDDDGVALPSGLYYFTIDNGSNNKEYLAGTLSGTSVTAVYTVSRQGVETSGAARAHRIGASVIITDFATYKKYMDNLALSGVPDASMATKGATKISVAPASDPIAVGDNDPRVPTQSENDALAATTSPSSSNKFITQKDLQIGSEIYAADAGSNDTYVITLSPAPAAYVTGMTIRFKANTANTGAATLNVNSLGAKTIKKSYNSDLTTGDIVASQVVEVIYDGTNFQIQSVLSGSISVVNSGQTTKDLSTVGTQTIAHGLGITPKIVRFSMQYGDGASGASVTIFSICQAVYSNGSTVGTYLTVRTGDGATTSFNLQGGSTRIYTRNDGGGSYYNEFSVSSVDSTNISLLWAKSGTPTGTVTIVWDAEA